MTGPTPADPPETRGDATAVRALLGAAGLDPPEDDLRSLTAMYADVRLQLAALWAVELGEVDPATVYRPGAGDDVREHR